MKYNLYAIFGAAAVFGLCLVLRKCKRRGGVLQVLAAALLLYKTVYYVKKNLTTEFCPPIEISAQSYFAVPLLYLFGGKKCRPAAAVLGILCGAGFFLGYGTLGFCIWNKLPHNAFFTAVVCHGILLTLGWFSLAESRFSAPGGSVLPLVLFMGLWAVLFYKEGGADLFFWRVLRPKFLFPASRPWQIPAALGYYGALVFLVVLAERLFFRWNAALFSETEAATLERAKEGE